jgi:transposase InsO family protein
MHQHANAKLGLAGRHALVCDVERGCSLREAARRRGVSPATACKWWRRWRQAGDEERKTRACLHDRSSRPHRSPRLLSRRQQHRICAARRRSGWGPRLIAGETGHAHATVWRALRRAGISRPPRPAREQVVRYEWPCPGDLLQIDSKRFARFTSPGHAVTGDRFRSGAEKRARVGYEFVHSTVDDHSRLAYSELHRDERAQTVVGFLERALAFYAAHGIEVKRLRSDNAWCYTKNRTLAELLARHGIELQTIPPRRPQANGKVERYQQTLKREWGLGQVYRSSDHRAAALSHWLSYYNERRSHSSLGGRPPISRVHNVSRQDS